MRLYRQAGWTCAHATRPPKSATEVSQEGFPRPTPACLGSSALIAKVICQRKMPRMRERAAQMAMAEQKLDDLRMAVGKKSLFANALSIENKSQQLQRLIQNERTQEQGAACAAGICRHGRRPLPRSSPLSARDTGRAP